MYVGAHFCVRCGVALDTASSDAASPILELTEFESWLPSPARIRVAPQAAEPPAASEEPSAASAELSSAASEEPFSAMRAEPSPREPGATISLEEVDRGFEFGDEKTSLSACLAVPRASETELIEEAALRPGGFSREEVLRRLRNQEDLRRADLSGLDLSGVNFDGADLTRAELEGAKLDRAKLCGAKLTNASLRNASLERANLTEANLERADLSGARLPGSTLDGASLRRANLNEADLSGASLRGARLSQAELTGANLSSAKLNHAELDDAELERADLGTADLSAADLENANLTLANLIGTNFKGASLVDANLTRAQATRADFSNATLLRATFSGAVLTHASLASADASHADLRGVDVRGAVLDGLRLSQALLDSLVFDAQTRVRFIDVAVEGSPRRLETSEALEFLAGRVATRPAKTRYFGPGDVLRNARLDFDAGSTVHVDSRFENCLIVLGDGAQLIVGELGVLTNCEIAGHGDITVHGCFLERSSPGISGARSLVVSATGAVLAVLRQPSEATAFAFEPGCRVRMKILQSECPQAAE